MAEGEVVCTSLKADGGKGRACVASCTCASVAGLSLIIMMKMMMG